LGAHRRNDHRARKRRDTNTSPTPASIVIIPALTISWTGAPVNGRPEPGNVGVDVDGGEVGGPVGTGLSVGPVVTLADGVGLAEGVTLGDGVGLMLGVGLALGVGVALPVGVGVWLGFGLQ